MIIAAIVAGGTGSRMGGKIPKQFLRLGSRTVLSLTCESFLKVPEVELVAVGVHPDWVDFAKEELAVFGERVLVTEGSGDRSGTLLNILLAAERAGADEDTVVLSHDAVRAFTDESIIRSHILALMEDRVTTTAIPAVDTVLVSGDGSYIGEVPDRSTLFQAQTPQAFRLGEYKEILGTLTAEERSTVTDVCGVYLKRNIPVRIIPGNAENFKLTTPFDFLSAEALYEEKNKEKQK